MFADFDGDESAVGVGNVGGIGDDEFELLAGDGGEEIALQEADAIGDVIASCVFRGEGEGGVRRCRLR